METTSAACSIELPEQPMDCCISSLHPVVATGLVNGDIFLHRYSSSEGSTSPHTITAEQSLRRRSPKAASCRCLAFSPQGDTLVAGFDTGSLLQLDATTGKVQLRLAKVHAAPLNRVLHLVQQPHLVAAGDEGGGLSVWDLRSQAAVQTYKKHTDFITGLATNPKESCLVAVSGDGTLSVHDLRAAKALARSEDDADDELLSVVVVKHGKKVVCGSQGGVLSLFSWGYWNDCSDRFPGHPESIDAIVKFDEDTVITGSSDGVLRVLSVLPNKLLGVVGEHADMPLERLALSGDHRVLASTSHDNAVKLWDLSCLHDDSGDEEEEPEAGEAEEQEEGEEQVAGPSAGGGSQQQQQEEEEQQQQQQQEEEGQEEQEPAAAAGPGSSRKQQLGEGSSSSSDGEGSDEEAGSSGSDSDADGQRSKKRRRKERTAMTKGRNKPSKQSNFFADLL